MLKDVGLKEGERGRCYVIEKQCTWWKPFYLVGMILCLGIDFEKSKKMHSERNNELGGNLVDTIRLCRKDIVPRN